MLLHASSFNVLEIVRGKLLFRFFWYKEISYIINFPVWFGSMRPLRNESFRYRNRRRWMRLIIVCDQSVMRVWKISVCNYDRWLVFLSPFFYLLNVWCVWPLNAARLFFCRIAHGLESVLYIFFCESDQVTPGATISWAWLAASDIARSEKQNATWRLHLYQNQQPAKKDGGCGSGREENRQNKKRKRLLLLTGSIGVASAQQKLDYRTVKERIRIVEWYARAPRSDVVVHRECTSTFTDFIIGTTRHIVPCLIYIHSSTRCVSTKDRLD